MRSRHAIQKRWLALAMSLTLFTASTAAASTFPPDFMIGDSDGAHADSSGSYLIRTDNLLPGDEVKKTISIRNFEAGSTYQLTLHAEPKYVQGEVDLLDKIWLRLTMGDNVLYEGRLYGDGKKIDGTGTTGYNMLDHRLDLGIYEYGSTAELKVELQLDPTLSKNLFYERSIAENRWIFTAVRTTNTPTPTVTAVPGTPAPIYPYQPVEPVRPGEPLPTNSPVQPSDTVPPIDTEKPFDSPATGDERDIQWMYVLLSASAIGMEITLILRKKKKQ